MKIYCFGSTYYSALYCVFFRYYKPTKDSIPKEVRHYSDVSPTTIMVTAYAHEMVPYEE